jgi:hypothetical protein
MRKNINSLEQDNRNTEDLVLLALAADNDEVRWNLITIMHYRGGAKEFQIAAELCCDRNPQQRKLGSDILGQLGWEDKTFLGESVNCLIKLLSDPDESVLSSAITALGHRKDPITIFSLCELASHPNPEIRCSVAFAIGTFEESLAIETAIQLSADIDRNVRNWATFGLGSLIETDSNEIREALFARSREKDNEIRGEALIGLAKRQDSRTLNLIKQELAGEFAGSWVLEASELLADASLVTPLIALHSDWCSENESRFGSELNDAIAACKSNNK